jgi:hypothetical protein
VHGVGVGAGLIVGTAQSAVVARRTPSDRWLLIPTLELAFIALRTSSAVIGPGASPKIPAAIPATCGDAILVPLIVLVAVVDVCHAAVMEEPGANKSRHVPKFEKDDRASELVVDPTVIALGSAAGE